MRVEWGRSSRGAAWKVGLAERRAAGKQPKLQLTEIHAAREWSRRMSEDEEGCSWGC